MNDKPDRLMLIVNPVSGDGEAIDILPETESIFAGMHVPIDIRITEKRGEATKFASQAAAAGYKRVVAIGGDGTINEVATGILGSEIILGVIPAGRVNNFFKLLSIGDDLNQICRVAAFGIPKLFDVGLLDDQPFFNNVGVGFDAVVATGAHKIKGNRYSYFKSIYKAWKKYSFYPVNLRIDNLELKLTISSISANIGQYTGGGFRITPYASPDDGKFDICVILKTKRSKIFSLIPQIAKGKHTRLPEVRMYRCRQLELSSDNPLPIHYEGETYHSSNGRLTIKSHPDKSRVAGGIDEKV